MLAKNCQLIEALQEVEIHEKDTTFLSPQCQFILGKGSSHFAYLCRSLPIIVCFHVHRSSPENSEMLKEELKRQPSMIERLYGENLPIIVPLLSQCFFCSRSALITDLYMDRATFKGQLVKDKVPMLLEILDNGDMDSLLAFFEES